jgi:hypothetical protein
MPCGRPVIDGGHLDYADDGAVGRRRELKVASIRLVLLNRRNVDG